METNPNTADKIARQVIEIIPHVMRVMMSEIRQSNMPMMPGHFRLLGMLSHHSRTLKELADRQSVSPPTMSNTITTLEERGWVTRTRSEADRRVVNIQVTEEGKRALEETHFRAESRIIAMLEPLDAAERDLLAQGLAVLHWVFESAYSGAAESDCPHANCKCDR